MVIIIIRHGKRSSLDTHNVLDVDSFLSLTMNKKYRVYRSVVVMKNKFIFLAGLPEELDVAQSYRKPRGLDILLTL